MSQNFRALVVAIAALAPSAALAQDLNCTNLVQPACDAANEIVGLVNAETGTSTLIQSSTRTAFRPTKVYKNMLQLQNIAAASGCSVVSGGGGIYDAEIGIEAFSGGFEHVDGSSASYDIPDGVWGVSPPSIYGHAVDGFGNELHIGHDVGIYHWTGPFATSIDEIDWQVGYWFRILGNRGVWYSVVGQCPANVDPGDVFENWYPGTLDSFNPVALDFVSSASPEAAIADGGPTNGTPGTPTCVTLPITGAGSRVVENHVELVMNVSHTWVGDLGATLESPDGTVVTLFDRPGFVTVGAGSTSDLVDGGLVRFIRSALADAEDMGLPNPVCSAGSLCDFAPDDPMNAFFGGTAEGDWEFCITDYNGGDVGVLHDVTLEIDAI